MRMNLFQCTRGGVHFAELSPEQAYSFQKDLLKTMLTIENTYIHVCILNVLYSL